VLVFGGGAAGVATAISAARAGLSVVLIETRDELGGTVVRSLIHTLAALYDDAGDFINAGLPVELAGRLIEADSGTCKRRIGRTWTLAAQPAVYAHVIRAWIAEERGIEVLVEHSPIDVRLEDGVVRGLQVASKDAWRSFEPLAVVDATGGAEIVRAIDRRLTVEEPRRAAGGLIGQVRGVRPGALAFPRNVGVMRAVGEAAARGDLPADCEHAWLDLGCLPDEVYLKLFVRSGGVAGNGEERRARVAMDTLDRLLQFLRTLPDFADAHLAAAGELGIRDSGGILGEYRLTGEDVRAGRRFDDAVCRCSWPIEYWDPEKGVHLEYLPPGTWYDIPLRALRVQGTTNLWAAGRCLSADAEARASARCVGTCWAMGDSLGQALADRVAGSRLHQRQPTE
jgi:hypothetical protein